MSEEITRKQTVAARQQLRQLELDIQNVVERLAFALEALTALGATMDKVIKSWTEEP